MEILKGFSFDLQLHAQVVTVKLGTTLATPQNLDLEGVTSGDLYVVTSAAWNATADNTANFTRFVVSTAAPAGTATKIGSVSVTPTGITLTVGSDTALLAAGEAVTIANTSLLASLGTKTFTFKTTGTRATQVDYAGIATSADSVTLNAAGAVVDAENLNLAVATVPFATASAVTIKDSTGTNSLTINGAMSVVESQLQNPTGTTVVSSMAPGSSVSTVASTEQVTTVTNAAGTYTINGKTYSTTQTTSGLTFTADAADVGTVSGLVNGSEFSTNDTTGLTVNGNMAAYSNTESARGVIKVAGVTYQSASAAAQNVSFYVNSSGNPLLLTGSVYLTAGSSVRGADAASAAANYFTITAVTGDINVVKTAVGDAIQVTDLDNGDSFTIIGTNETYTYEVVNGSLVNTTTGDVLSGLPTNTLSYSEVPDKVLSWSTTDFRAMAAGGAGVPTAGAKTDNTNASVGTAITAPDVTDITLTVNSTDTGAPRTVSQFANGDYLHKNGTYGPDSTNAVGQMFYDSASDIVTYQAVAGAKEQTISFAADTSRYKFNVKGTDGADTITGKAGEHTIDGGAGKDTITAGTQNTVVGGDGDDRLIGAANASLDGGAGKDVLFSASASTTLTGGDGEDTFVLTYNDGVTTYPAGTGVISDYKFGEDVLNTTLAAANLAALNATNFTADGVVSLGAGLGVVTVNGSNGNYQVMLQNNARDKQAVGWTGESGTGVDFSGQSTSAILIGGRNESGVSLYGGSGADIIYAGSNDTVYGAAGRNTINLNGTEGATVGFGVSSGIQHDVVNSFNASFNAETGDKVYLVDTSDLKTSLSSAAAGATANLTLKSGSSDMVLNNITVASTGAAEVLFGDTKAAFVGSGNTATIESADYANYIYGTKVGTVGSGLNLSKIEDSIMLDLNSSNYKNFTTVTGGTGNTTLVGAGANETLISAGGNTSLYGGAGKDVLVGASKATDSFFMFAGGGNDTVNGFEGYTESTADTADAVVMEELTSAKLISGGVQLAGKDSDKLFIKDANANTEIQYSVGGSVGIAKIGSVSGANSFTFAKEVNYYGGGSAVDTLTFNNSDSDNHKVWLDGSKGTTYTSIDVINAANATGDLELAGDSSKQTITGGRGSSSLWGGTGATNDVLKGGTGTNTFFYGLAEGNDTITCGTVDDVVNLYNIGLGDLASGEITSSAVTLTLKDSSKLTVNTGSRDIAFKLSDGSTYVANHSTKQWDNA